MMAARSDEFNWSDRDDCSGCVLGYHEVRLQQPDCPAPDGPPSGPVADDDHDGRRRLHVHASSVADCTFWVERFWDERHGEQWKATEVETGVTGAPGADAEDAILRYFADDLWPGARLSDGEA